MLLLLLCYRTLVVLAFAYPLTSGAPVLFISKRWKCVLSMSLDYENVVNFFQEWLTMRVVRVLPFLCAPCSRVRAMVRSWNRDKCKYRSSSSSLLLCLLLHSLLILLALLRDILIHDLRSNGVLYSIFSCTRRRNFPEVFCHLIDRPWISETSRSEMLPRAGELVGQHQSLSPLVDTSFFVVYDALLLSHEHEASSSSLIIGFMIYVFLV